jgi:hypothetical protein
VIAKDLIKEALMDHFGGDEPVGVAAFAVQFTVARAILESGSGLILCTSGPGGHSAQPWLSAEERPLQVEPAVAWSELGCPEGRRRVKASALLLCPQMRLRQPLCPLA